MSESNKSQNDWVVKLTGWLEKNRVFDVSQLNSATSEVAQAVRDVAEAVVRYTADTQTSNFEQFTHLAQHVQAVNREQQREQSDWLSQTVDTVIAIADRENRPKTTASPCNEHVIVLHGLTRSALSMTRIAQNLENRGYSVTNVDYPSTEDTIEELVEGSMKIALEEVSAEIEKIHFVTHSMGGIMVRYYLKQYPLDRVGRVVMLSPPNRGSELIDIFGAVPLYAHFSGPAGKQLSTAPDSLPNQLGPVDFELGVLMGTRSVSPFLSTMLPGANDGKVSVERAKIDGMNDFLLVPTNHTFIMQEPSVIEQIIHFLGHGSFDRGDIA